MEETANVALTLIQNLRNTDSNVRRDAVFNLARIFPHAPDKDLATKELLALAEDDDQNVRQLAARIIGEIYIHLTQKEKATRALISLTNDKDLIVRINAINSICSAFIHLSDKENVIKHLLSLTNSDNSTYIIYDALQKILASTVFEIWSPEILNMEQIISYLLEFTKNESRFNRFVVIDSDQDWKTFLESVKDDTKSMDTRGFHAAFVQVQDKEQALRDILALMNDSNPRIKQNAFIAFIKILTPVVP